MLKMLLIPQSLYLHFFVRILHVLMLPGLLSTVPPTTATWDFLFNWYLFFGVGAAVVVISMLAYFMLRYRHRGESTPMPEHKTEGWKIVLVTVLISISILSAAEYQTFASFSNIEVPSQCTLTPSSCVWIHVTGFQWGWNFTYPSGTYKVGDLVVPADRIVVLSISSKDVFHSFGLPMMAEKEDAIPGRTNQLWFNATQTGFYQDAIRCYELCGIGHAFMMANFTVVSQTTWTSLMSLNQSQFSKYGGGAQ